MMKQSSTLEMKYHPAMKEVRFRRFQNGEEIEISSRSRLRGYMNQKDFVLQYQGNEFFQEIAYVFNGDEYIDMEVITTALDYEDFEEMTAYYHQTQTENCSCEIRPKLTGELPDMTETFAAVKTLGTQSIEMLKEHEKKFSVRKTNLSLKESVRKSAERYHEVLQRNIENITSKMRGLDESQVSLFFTGAYSSGKSTLINAILGYRILPEAIKPKTARVFCISSPLGDRAEGLRFECSGQSIELAWNSEIKRFNIPPADYPLREEIFEWTNEIEKKRKFEQFYAILDRLNNEESVGTEIQVTFPIPLDNDKVRFRIYDTPGTDSNSEEHHRVLQSSMKDQLHAILIFVCAPDRMEGSGNNKILQFLKENEKAGNTGIDRDRSLFVINRAETVDNDELETLKNGSIKCKGDDENFQFDLEKKKVFFTSAKNAYCAKAVKNNIATDKDKKTVEKTDLADLDSLHYFLSQFNHVAQSEFATNAMRGRCERALKAAEESDNREDAIHVCSGLYALEDEISRYGEKYAAAVKASALIGAVGHVLCELQRETGVLNEENVKAIEEVEKEINRLREILSDSIVTAHNKRKIVDNKLPDDTSKRLHVDRASVQFFVENEARREIEECLNKKKRWFFKGIEFSKKTQKELKEIADRMVRRCRGDFLEACRQELEKQRDGFIKDVRGSLQQNGGISEAAKKYIADNIAVPDIKEPRELGNVTKIYEDARKVETVLFILDLDNVDKEKFLEDTETFLMTLFGKLNDAFIEAYTAELAHIIDVVQKNFMERLEMYSIQLHALNEDRNQMEQYREELGCAMKDIKGHQKHLEEIIWKEKNK